MDFLWTADGAWDGGVTNNVFSMMTDGAWDGGVTNVRMADGGGTMSNEYM